MSEKIKIYLVAFMITIVIANNMMIAQRDQLNMKQYNSQFIVCFTVEGENKVFVDSETAVRRMVLQMIPWEKENHEMIHFIEEYTDEQRMELWNALLMIQRTNLYAIWEKQEYPDIIVMPTDYIIMNTINNGCYEYEKEIFHLQMEKPEYCIFLNNPARIDCIPYCYVSAGKTRDYHYANGQIEGVTCKEDYNSQEFVHEYSFSKDEFDQYIGELFQVDKVELVELQLIKDNNSYVNCIRLRDAEIFSTDVRQKFSLFSPNFEWREVKEQINITCYGMGSGYGISIYTLMEMIKQNKSCDEIFTFFFQDSYLKRAV